MIGSCGTKLGRVEHIPRRSLIKLTNRDSPDGMHHLIPNELGWQDVDDQVHLSKTCGEAAREWQTVLPIIEIST